MALKDLLAKYENGGNFQRAGWFTLKDDGDTAMVRMLPKGKLADGDYDLDIHEVHKIKIDGHDRSVLCLGDGCPACRADLKPSLRVWIPLVNLDEPDKDKQVQIWERGIGDIKKLLGIIEEYGDLNARDFKIKRNGKANSQKTFYDFFPKDKKERELPERPKILGGVVLELSPEDMKKALNGTLTLKKDSDGKRDAGEEAF